MKYLHWDWISPIVIIRQFLPPKVYNIVNRKLSEELQQIIEDYRNELE